MLINGSAMLAPVHANALHSTCSSMSSSVLSSLWQLLGLALQQQGVLRRLSNSDSSAGALCKWQAAQLLMLRQQSAGPFSQPQLLSYECSNTATRYSASQQPFIVNHHKAAGIRKSGVHRARRKVEVSLQPRSRRAAPQVQLMSSACRSLHLLELPNQLHDATSVANRLPNEPPHLPVQPPQQAPAAGCAHARQQRLRCRAADEGLAGRAGRAVGAAMLLLLRLALLLLALQP